VGSSEDEPPLISRHDEARRLGLRRRLAGLCVFVLGAARQSGTATHRDEVTSVRHEVTHPRSTESVSLRSGGGAVDRDFAPPRSREVANTRTFAIASAHWNVISCGDATLSSRKGIEKRLPLSLISEPVLSVVRGMISKPRWVAKRKALSGIRAQAGDRATIRDRGHGRSQPQPARGPLFSRVWMGWGKVCEGPVGSPVEDFRRPFDLEPLHNPSTGHTPIGSSGSPRVRQPLNPFESMDYRIIPKLHRPLCDDLLDPISCLVSDLDHQTTRRETGSGPPCGCPCHSGGSGIGAEHPTFTSPA
jgi:hypothetical protein